MSDNNVSLVFRPTAKKVKGFKREYPFPIIKDDNVGENQLDTSWTCMEGELHENCVLVHDEESMKLLYKKGFFGKGTLSKYAPQICSNTYKEKDKEVQDEGERKWLPGSSKDLSDEDIICVEDLDNDNVISTKDPSGPKELDVEVLLDSDSDDNGTSAKRIKYSQPTHSAEKESLQLTFQEAYFLSYGLGCLIVKDKEHPLNLTRLWHKLCDLTADNNFPVMYAAYHHFRSKGWIVKCGLKYGVDYVLYKDGPPFYHASYSVVVKHVREQGLRDTRGNRQFTWNSLAALNRINKQAGKELIFLYVIKPHQVSESKISTPFCISQYKLEEVLIKRWVAAENREEKDG